MDKPDKTYGIFNSDINQKLLKKLGKDGERVIKFPVVQKSSVEFTNVHKEILNNLQKFDWIIITDVFAADFFIEFLEFGDIDLFELDNLRVCAYGESVADRLRFVQLHSDIIANKIDDDSILKQITEYIFDLSEFTNLDFLFVQGNDKGFEIKGKLNELKANVTEFAVYANQTVENVTKLKLLTLNGAIDEFIFGSSDEVFDLAEIFLDESLSSALKDLKVMANNETTFQTLREFGIAPKLYK